MFSDAIGQPLAITVMRNGALVDVIAEPTGLSRRLTPARPSVTLDNRPAMMGT